MKSIFTIIYKSFITLLIFLLVGINSNAQEKLFDLSTNPKLTQENKNHFQRNTSSWYPRYVYGITDTINLPFVDDFSSNKFPDYYYYSYLVQNRGNGIFASRKINGIIPTNPIIEYSRIATTQIDSTQNPPVITTNGLVSLSFFSMNTVYPSSPFVADSTAEVYPAYNTFINPNGIEFQALSASFFRDSLITDSVYTIKLSQKNALWIDKNETVFSNNSFPINPPTIGCITFDGLNKFGMPYNFSAPTTYGSADTVTSKPINLNYSSNPGVYMMFYYQAKGRGNDPEFEDSLRLEFRTPKKNWTRVWGKTGYNPGTDTNFVKVILNINDTAYLKNAFQFRFRNNSSLSGNLDHWNVDYILISADANDTIIKDAAFVYPIKSFIRPYTSMPYNQYSSANMISATQNYIRNLSNADINISYRFRITDFFEANTYSSFDVDNINFFSNALNNCELCSRVLNPLLNLGYQFPQNTECTEYKIKQYIQPLSISSNSNNDTLVHLQQFANYFSYDDGSAEAAYGIENSPLAEVLCEYELITPTTLKALQIHFNPALSDVSFQDFSIVVRSANTSANTPGDSLYEQEYLVPQYSQKRDGFYEYTLNTPLSLPAGKFYVGIKQYYNLSLNIGFDRNINNYDKIFFKQFQGSWFNTQFNGSLMIRPVVADCINGLPSPIIENELTDKMEIFPNPANNFLFASKGILTIYDILGNQLLQLNNLDKTNPIDVSEFSSGIYLIKLQNNNNIVSQKLIIQR